MIRAATALPKLAPPLGRMPTLQFCRPIELHIDQSYQRDATSDASLVLIRRIAQHWNWDLCQPLVVARRQGLIEQLFVIDGQHRLAAARLRGDIDQLPCVILSYGSSADEAASFVHLNQQRRPLSKLELFKAAVASGDAKAVEIVAAMTAAGLSIAPHSNFNHWKPGMVSNISGIEQAWRPHGAEPTKAAMQALRYAFLGQPLQYAGTIFPGIVAVCDDEFRMRGSFGGPRADALAQFLGETSQVEWRAEILRARSEDANLNWGAAARMVIRKAWAKDCRPGSSAMPAPAAQPAPATCAKVAPVAAKPANTIRQQRPTVPMRLTTGAVSRNFKPDGDGRAWCEQCDRRVTAGVASTCKDRFCELRKG
jgi:hypothetical protein